MAKQNPYRFSLGFDEEDPDHQEVARILNQLGHRKAKFEDFIWHWFLVIGYRLENV